MPRRRARKKKSLAISGRTDAVAHPLAVDLSKADRTHGVRHVAIIMDGNGRWAKKRLLPRFAGHKEGVEAVRRTARAARAMGLEVMTRSGERRVGKEGGSRWRTGWGDLN